MHQSEETTFQFGSSHAALAAMLQPPVRVTPSENFIRATRQRLLRWCGEDLKREDLKRRRPAA